MNTDDIHNLFNELGSELSRFAQLLEDYNLPVNANTIRNMATSIDAHHHDFAEVAIGVSIAQSHPNFGMHKVKAVTKLGPK